MADTTILTWTAKSGAAIEIRMREYLPGTHIAHAYLDGQYVNGPNKPVALASPRGDITHYMGGGLGVSKADKQTPGIGLTAERAQLVLDALAGANLSWTQTEAGQTARLRREREGLVAAYNGAVEDQRHAFDRAHEREDVRAWDIKSEREPAITAALAAVRTFDAEHPEIIAAIKVEREASRKRHEWD